MHDEETGRAHLQATEAALATLGRAERDGAASPPTWSAFAARLAQPRPMSRVPLNWVTALRPLSEFARPAMAGTLAAMLTGVALGTWLALAFDRGPTVAALASTSYSGSSLLDGDEPGLDMYLGSNESGDVAPGEDSLHETQGGSP